MFLFQFCLVFIGCYFSTLQFALPFPGLPTLPIPHRHSLAFSLWPSPPFNAPSPPFSPSAAAAADTDRAGHSLSKRRDLSAPSESHKFNTNFLPRQKLIQEHGNGHCIRFDTPFKYETAAAAPPPSTTSPVCPSVCLSALSASIRLPQAGFLCRDGNEAEQQEEEQQHQQANQP